MADTEGLIREGITELYPPGPALIPEELDEIEGEANARTR